MTIDREKLFKAMTALREGHRVLSGHREASPQEIGETTAALWISYCEISAVFKVGEPVKGVE